jgi:hypothetical protein
MKRNKMKSRSQSSSIRIVPQQAAQIGIQESGTSTFNRAHFAFEFFIEALIKVLPVLNKKKSSAGDRKRAIESLEFLFNRYIDEVVNSEMILQKWDKTKQSAPNSISRQPYIEGQKSIPDFAFNR